MSSAANSPTPSSAAVANDAALIVTFYYLRTSAGQSDLSERLMTHLKQELGQTQPDGNHNVWLERFNPVEKSARDISVVQLALNASDKTERADSAWVKLSNRLGKLLGDEHLFIDMIGYSLIYQAVLKPGMTPLFNKLLPDKAKRRKLLLNRPSVEVLKPLATSNMQDGHLWLLHISLPEQGRHASAVYVAVCLEQANDDFVSKVLWGESASWLLPDLITHKSYHQIRQYYGIMDGQVTFSSKLQQVRDTTLDLLSDTTKQKASDEFSQLSKRSQSLIRDMAKLGALRITLAKQEYSYSQWLDKAQAGDIVTFQSTRIKANLKELELNLAEAETVLKVTDTTLNIMQTGLDKAQEKRQLWLSIILALLGVALAVPQVIDRKVTDALWAWWNEDLTVTTYNTLQLWGVQLFITAIIGAIVTLLIVFLYQAMRIK